MNGEPESKKLKLNEEGNKDHIEHGEKEEAKLDAEKIDNETPVAGSSNLKATTNAESENSMQITTVASSQTSLSAIDRSTSLSTVDRANSPKILKMDCDCFDEIFNYLRFEDLLSMGKTCKTLQTYVGDYYKRHFTHRNYEIQHDGIYANYALILAANEFITRLQIRFCSFQPLYDINSRIDQFTSLRHITFSNMDLMEPNYDRIQKIFDKIESIHLRSCLPDFCNKCLNLCGNLKRISIRHSIPRTFHDDDEFPWLFGTYQKLEHFELNLMRDWPIDGLSGFLERNQNIHTFATSGLCLWVNRTQLLNSNVKLDILEIRMMEVYGVDLDEFVAADTRTSAICKLINQLFDRAFYQRLHFYITDDEQITSIDELTSLHGLEKLCIEKFKRSYRLKPLTFVKELVIINGIEHIDREWLAEQCVNLERLYIGVNTINDILPFIQRSAKLYKIIVLTRFYKLNSIYTNISPDKIRISTWDKERSENLSSARKLIIYMPDDLYVNTKWNRKNGCVNMNAIELRRGQTFDDFLDNEIN